MASCCAVYDERYASKEQHSILFLNLTREKVAKVIKIGENVLDIAAGSAYFTIILAEITQILKSLL